MPAEASKHGYENEEFRQAASDYYDVDSAIKFFDAPVPPNHKRWRCFLCGWGIDVNPAQEEMVGATCCGGCGMTCLRPIEEWGGR